MFSAENARQGKQPFPFQKGLESAVVCTRCIFIIMSQELTFIMGHLRNIYHCIELS